MCRAQPVNFVRGLTSVWCGSSSVRQHIIRFDGSLALCASHKYQSGFMNAPDIPKHPAVFSFPSHPTFPMLKWAMCVGSAVSCSVLKVVAWLLGQTCLWRPWKRAFSWWLYLSPLCSSLKASVHNRCHFHRSISLASKAALTWSSLLVIFIFSNVFCACIACHNQRNCTAWLLLLGQHVLYESTSAGNPPHRFWVMFVVFSNGEILSGGCPTLKIQLCFISKLGLFIRYW